MFIVLKENEGGFTSGINGGVSNFGTGTHLNNGYSQANAGTVYGNAFGANSLLSGNPALSMGANLGGNVVGSVPHALAGYLPTNTQRREIQVVNTLTGQIVPAIQEITPIATCTALNHLGVAGTVGHGVQTTWGHDISAQKALMVNLIDNDQSYCIECFSPEFDVKNSEVTMTPNGLRIRVTNGKSVDSTAGFYTIPTPWDVDGDKITATSSKGFLKINLPRSKKALENIKKIKVD